MLIELALQLYQQSHMFPAITCYSIAEFSIDIEREMQSSTDLRICISYNIIRLCFRRISVHRYTPISAEYRANPRRMSS